jgi:hypothetical protein
MIGCISIFPFINLLSGFSVKVVSKALYFVPDFVTEFALIVFSVRVKQFMLVFTHRYIYLVCYTHCVYKVLELIFFTEYCLCYLMVTAGTDYYLVCTCFVQS